MSITHFKKLISIKLFLATALVWVLLPAHYAQAQNNLGVFVPPSHASSDQTGFYVAGEIIFLRPFTEVPFAISDEDGSPARRTVASDNARLLTMSFDYEASYRVSIGYDKPNSPWEWRLSYTRVESDAAGSAEAPAGGELLVQNVFIATSGIGITAREANSRTKFELDVVDLIARYGLRLFPAGDDSVFEMALFAGVRYAETENDFHGIYKGAVNCAAICRENIQTEFWGIGPRMGSEVAWDFLPGSNIKLFANAAISLLLGEVDASVNNSRGTNRVGDLRIVSKSHAVPVLDMQIGVNWFKKFGGFLVSATAGYDFQNWFNMTSNRNLQSGDSNSFLGNPSVDLILDGPFARLGVTF